MGTVFQAVELAVDRTVALKVFHPAAAVQLEHGRLRREARFLQQLEHPNVVRLFDAELGPPAPFLAMEYLDGVTLAERTRGGPLPERAVRGMLAQLLGALEAVHAAGILHRDIKPSNVFLTADSRAVLIDFGMARDQDPKSAYTGAGAIVGTTRFLAPELLTGAAHSPVSDLFALALAAVEAWTGLEVHEVGEATAADALPRVLSSLASGAYHAVLHRHLKGRGRLAAVLVKATEPDPARRFATAAEMARAATGV
jgi:serine/threonine protein kinase